MRKKILIASILFMTVVGSTFAHSLTSITPLIGVSYDTKKGVPLFVGANADINSLALSFDVSTKTSFNSIGGDVFIGGILGYFNENDNFLKMRVMFGGNADYGFKRREMTLSPYGRISFSYTTPFNMDIQLFCDVGYTFNLGNKALNGFSFRGGFTLGYSFSLGKKLVKKYDNRYDDLYVSNKKKFAPLDINKDKAKLTDEEQTKQDVKEEEYKESAEEFNKGIEDVFLAKVKEDVELNAPQGDIIAENRDKMTQSPKDNSYLNGAIVRYRYDRSSQYKIFLTPLNITDIRLEDRETVVSIVLGDVNNWNAETIQTSENVNGEDKLITHVLLRPLNTNIQTDCMVATDSRIYYLKLYSTPTTYMTAVEWTYRSSTPKNGSITPKVNEVKDSFDNLNFNYVIKGDEQYKPQRAFSDTKRTYIQFANDFYSSTYAPVPYLENVNGDRSIINFTQRGITYTLPLILKNGEKIVLIDDGKDMATIMREY